MRPGALLAIETGLRHNRDEEAGSSCWVQLPGLVS